MEPIAIIENRIFEEIALGESASMSRTLTEQDIELFALVSGDVNPAHLDPDYAASGMFHHVIAHGMWGGGLISAVLGTLLPGPGTIYLSQSLSFRGPVAIGDVITATVTVREKRADKQHVLLDCLCQNQDGKIVITGSAEVIAPSEKIRRPRIALPDVRLSRHHLFQEIFERSQGLPPLAMAVAHPCDALSLQAALEGARAGLVRPILVGPEARIRSIAAQEGLDISELPIRDTPHSHASAAQAVALVKQGEAALLMKGSLHTDELMREVVAAGTGLRTGRRLSHVYMMEVPLHPRMLLVTDAAINIAPNLEEKRDIIQNAIDLALLLGISQPKVAILAAVETVNPAMPSTLDAAALCKMAERGQISGGILDGPLAFDNAVSIAAAQQKGIISEVAGRADILMVPDLEAGNMLAKQLTFLAGADAAGLVMGASVPIILTSRADNEKTRIASCSVAVLVARSKTA